MTLAFAAAVVVTLARQQLHPKPKVTTYYVNQPSTNYGPAEAASPGVKWLDSPMTAVGGDSTIGTRIDWEIQIGLREDGVVVWRKR